MRLVSAWTDDQLRRVGGAHELQIAPVRRNGALRGRTTIWVVRAGDDLYVRAAYGPATGWHRVARTSHQARIWAGEVEADVALEQVEGEALDLVDEAYREKYGRHSSIVDGITNDQARATTLRLIAREAG
jgi:hypothetical protein